MNNQEAIGVLESINAKTDYFLINDDARAEAIDMAISALQAQDLSETQKALDTISRQAAIDALGKDPGFKIKLFGKSYDEGRSDQWFKDVHALIALPSVQQEPEHTMEEFMYGQDLGSPEDGSL